MQLVTGDEVGLIRFWDVALGRRLLDFADVKTQVNCVLFSRDGRYLAAALEKGAVYLWEADLP
jgi:WD40 repeat protein